MTTAERFSDKLVFASSGLFAAWTILAQIAMLSGLSFRALTYLYIGSIFAFVGLGRPFFRHLRGDREWAATDDGVAELGYLIVLMFAGGFLALGAIRPDGDDVSYISRTLYFLAHPDLPMDLSFHHHALLDFPMRYPLILPYTVEHFWGFISFVTRFPYLDVYHKIVPFAGGMAIPMAWYMAMSRTTATWRAALLGTVAVVAYLGIDGGTHHAFGNFAFVRIWQGKAILLSIVAPLFFAYSVDYLSRPTITNWLKLFSLATASVGLTATALFFVPFLAMFLACGYVFREDFRLDKVRRLVAYFGALAYLLLIGVYLRLSENPADYHFLGFELGFPSTFVGQWSMVFGRGLTYSFAMFIVGAMTSLALVAGSQRRFLIGWLVAGFGIVLNPWMMPVISKHFTTDNAYWRLIYALPFPLVVGISVSAAAERVKLSSKATFFAGLLLLCTSGLFNVLFKDTSTFGKVPFVYTAHKIYPSDEHEFREIIDHSERGAMLAPMAVSTWIPVLTADLPQLSIRHIFLKHFAILNHRERIAAERIKAMSFVAGQDATAFRDFERQLSLDVRNVVIVSEMRSNTVLTTSLQEHNFHIAVETTHYVLYIRN